MRHAVTYVVGHKNPDTDSICSAIAYARLKEVLTGLPHLPMRAGQLNEETRYVLRRFHTEPPAFLDTLEPRVSDIPLQSTGSLRPDMTLKEAWEQMTREEQDTQPVVAQGVMQGLVTVGDIALAYLTEGDRFADAGVRCESLVRTLDGQLLSGDGTRSFTRGKVVIATSRPEAMAQQVAEGDLVILGDQEQAQRAALDAGGSWLVICQNAPVAPSLLSRARDSHRVVITTPHDSYTAARLIHQSIPVGHIMRRSPLITFRQEDFVADIRGVMTKQRFRCFPVLDRAGGCVGLLYRRDLLNLEKRQVILVDHNEKAQAVDGIAFAEVTEVIDHHRIGSTIETMHPVYFRNMPLGCTATIIAMMYHENDCKPDRATAGLLLSAILSDTLAFRSPTCTSTDRKIAKKLAKRANVNMDELAYAMFQAGSRLEGKSEEELLYQDFKTFLAGPYRIGVGQLSTLGEESRDALRRRMLPYMARVRASSRLDVIFLMLTDIMDESTLLLCEGEGGEKIVREAFRVDCDNGTARLPGVLSRKKQTVPSILTAIQRMDSQGFGLRAWGAHNRENTGPWEGGESNVLEPQTEMGKEIL